MRAVEALIAVLSGRLLVRSGQSQQQDGQRSLANYAQQAILENLVVCVKLCKKRVMVSAADQAATFSSSFFCSISRLTLR
jgi:hypothetical protein